MAITVPIQSVGNGMVVMQPKIMSVRTSTNVDTANEPEPSNDWQRAAHTPVQCCGDIVDSDLCEGRGIPLPTHHSSHLAHQRLNQVT